MASSLIRNPGRLTTLSAECYIKYNATAREDEFYRTFVNKVASSDADTTNRTVQTIQTPPASSDPMCKYLMHNFMMSLETLSV